MSGAGTRTLAAAILRSAMLRPSLRRPSLRRPSLHCPEQRKPDPGGPISEGGEEAAHLLVMDGPLTGLRFSLGPRETLGRGRAASLRLPDPGASRVHARFRIEPGSLRVEDLGSKNGLVVNGRTVRRHGWRRGLRLRRGDRITVGSTRLEVEWTGPRSPNRPAGLPGLPSRAVTWALLAAAAVALTLSG